MPDPHVDRVSPLVVEIRPDVHDLAFLEERLAEAAIAAVGIGEEHEFGIFVRSDDGDEGRIQAGVFGSVWGGCCQVHALWVDEPLRGSGLARALMAGAEDEARRQGCRLLMGLTYAALTGDFYDRLGYRIVGALENCPDTTTTRWYAKDL